MVRALAASVAFLTALTCPSFALSQTAEPTPLADRWIPGISTTLLVFDYQADGIINGSLGSSSARASRSVPTFRIGFELMTPTFPGLPAAPRLMGFGGAVVGPRQKLDLGNSGTFIDGQPEEGIAVRTRLNNLLPNVFPFPDPSTYLGQGTALEATQHSIGWFVGLAAVFDIPGPDSTFRVKPLVTYLREQASIEGVLVVVTGAPGQTPPTVNRLQVKSPKKTFHSIGPGFEAEIILDKGDNIAVSLFAQLNYLWQVGDPTLSAAIPGFATYDVTEDRSGIRGGAGLRFTWRSAPSWLSSD